jgi:hypothetical protein
MYVISPVRSDVVELTGDQRDRGRQILAELAALRRRVLQRAQVQPVELTERQQQALAYATPQERARMLELDRLADHALGRTPQLTVDDDEFGQLTALWTQTAMGSDALTAGMALPADRCQAALAGWEGHVATAPVEQVLTELAQTPRWPQLLAILHVGAAGEGLAVQTTG